MERCAAREHGAWPVDRSSVSWNRCAAMSSQHFSLGHAGPGQEVLAARRHGETNAVIAARLRAPVETAKTHVENVLHKLGSTHRDELLPPSPGLRRESQSREGLRERWWPRNYGDGGSRHKLSRTAGIRSWVNERRDHP